MDNKEKILEVALELFSLKGYNSVGIQEIVQKVGIRKPTLYYYFGNKEGLLDALFSRYFSELNNKTAMVAGYKGDLTKVLKDLVTLFFNFTEKNIAFSRLQLNTSFDPPESTSFKVINPYLKEQYKIIEQLFVNASEDHGNMKNRHSLFAFSFLGMIKTYISLYLAGYISFNDDLKNEVVHQFMHGIFS